MPLTRSQLRKLRSLPDDVPNRLAAARKLMHLRQVELAAALNITQPMLSDFERQRWATTTDANEQMFADFFGCEIEDLFPSHRHAVAS